jgi:hypothetical protein
LEPLPTERSALLSLNCNIISNKPGVLESDYFKEKMNSSRKLTQLQENYHYSIMLKKHTQGLIVDLAQAQKGITKSIYPSFSF